MIGDAAVHQPLMELSYVRVYRELGQVVCVTGAMCNNRKESRGLEESILEVRKLVFCQK